MAKYEPSEKDLGYNPYITDQETFDKLNGNTPGIDYDIGALDHRKRLDKWKERERLREQKASELGIDYKPNLTPVKNILKNKK